MSLSDAEHRADFLSDDISGKITATITFLLLFFLQEYFLLKKTEEERLRSIKRRERLEVVFRRGVDGRRKWFVMFQSTFGLGCDETYKNKTSIMWKDGTVRFNIKIYVQKYIAL